MDPKFICFLTVCLVDPSHRGVWKKRYYRMLVWKNSHCSLAVTAQVSGGLGSLTH
jgi:hypothetical protein